MRKISIAVLGAALLFIPSATVHAGSVASAAKKGAAVGLANVSLFAGTIASKGGKGTTDVTITSFSPGFVDLKFTGKYPDDITPGNVILQSTAQSANYSVTNGFVSSASPTEIDVTIYEWSSDTLNNQTDNVFIALFIGG
ncbi:MAG TPA: hypothetical protein VN634_06495 [Candidatus Limnocylindrales bacterium]|jgi:hypothetical protein|nr:hypothetical protein [Candidatus Limnocylindrales bacterium]